MADGVDGTMTVGPRTLDAVASPSPTSTLVNRSTLPIILHLQPTRPPGSRPSRLNDGGRAAKLTHQSNDEGNAKDADANTDACPADELMKTGGSEIEQPGIDEGEYYAAENFENQDQLMLWLVEHSVDVTKWGESNPDGSKGVADLFKEIQEGEAKLTLLKPEPSDGTSPCRRITDVCRVWVRRAETKDLEGGGKVLFETIQVRNLLATRQALARVAKMSAYMVALGDVFSCMSTLGPTRRPTPRHPPDREVQARRARRKPF